MEMEYELNRAWIYSRGSDEPIGEKNFVVTAEFLCDLWEYFKKALGYSQDYTLDDFLTVYEPETDGEFIYQFAKRNGELVEDLGSTYYDNNGKHNRWKRFKKKLHNAVLKMLIGLNLFSLLYWLCWIDAIISWQPYAIMAVNFCFLLAVAYANGWFYDTSFEDEEACI